MNNVPQIKIALVCVSRSQSGKALLISRREALAQAYGKKYGEIYECGVCIENEFDVGTALEDIGKEGCNALVACLGGAGLESTEILLIKSFDGPSMITVVAEADSAGAYNNLLGESYDLEVRSIRAHIPERPVGTAEECADKINEFVPVANVVNALKNLKIISFGHHFKDFVGGSSPIKFLQDIGTQTEENSEAALPELFNRHKGDARIAEIVCDMENDFAIGNKTPELLERLARYELTLLDRINSYNTSGKHIVVCIKCRPAFRKQLGIAPCYVNSRLAAKGIIVSCESDIYGVIGEFIGTVISREAVTLLDINNSVPSDMYNKYIKQFYDYSRADTFVGFQYGNTALCKRSYGEVNYRMIMPLVLQQQLARGVLNGSAAPRSITFYRICGTPKSKLTACIAQGEILPVQPCLFGGIGVAAIKGMGDFYRQVLIKQKFPHHGAVLFGHYGKALYNVFKFIGIPEIACNQ